MKRFPQHLPIPEDSRFFHRVDQVDEDRKDLLGCLIFSPYDYHKDVTAWSHDSDFPWFLEHPNESFLVSRPGQKFIIVATVLEEWQCRDQRPHITYIESWEEWAGFARKGWG